MKWLGRERKLRWMGKGRGEGRLFREKVEGDGKGLRGKGEGWG